MGSDVPDKSLATSATAADQSLAKPAAGVAKLTSVRPERASSPPSGVTDQPALWLLLLLCLALMLPLMLVELHRNDVTHPGEARALVQARELHDQLALLDTNGILQLEPWVPLYNGHRQYTAHPGLDWIYATGIGLHEHLIGPVGPQRLILIGRCTSALFAGMVIVGVFWAGRCIGGNYTAAFAALLCLSTPILIYHGRLATAEMPSIGFSTLAVASALWAIRPLKPAPSVWRQALGWGFSGLCLAGALLVAGPIAWLTVGLPMLMMIVLCPGRIGHVLGLIATLLTGFVLVLPWTLFVYDRQPTAWLAWIEPLIPSLWQDPLGFVMEISVRLGLVMLLLLPWTLWLLGGLGQPFSPSSKGARVRMFLGWIWFAPLTLLLVSLPKGDEPAFLLPLIPAAAVLIGQTFSQFVELAAQGRYAKTWRRLCWMHLFLLVAASVIIPLLIQTQSPPVEAYFAPMGWTLVVGLIVILWTILLLGLRTMLGDYPGKSLSLWAGWSMILLFTLLIPFNRGPLAHQPLRYAMPAMMELVGSEPIHWLSDEPPHEPHPVVLLYAQRAMPQVTLKQLKPLLQDQPQVYVMASSPPPLPQAQLRMHLPSLGRSLYLCRANPAIGSHNPSLPTVISAPPSAVPQAADHE